MKVVLRTNHLFGSTMYAFYSQVGNIDLLTIIAVADHRPFFILCGKVVQLPALGSYRRTVFISPPNPPTRRKEPWYCTVAGYHNSWGSGVPLKENITVQSIWKFYTNLPSLHLIVVMENISTLSQLDSSVSQNSPPATTTSTFIPLLDQFIS